MEPCRPRSGVPRAAAPVHHRTKYEDRGDIVAADSYYDICLASSLANANADPIIENYVHGMQVIANPTV